MTVAIAEDEQVFPSVTVTDNSTVPAFPDVKEMELVPSPESMTPFVILQE